MSFGQKSAQQPKTHCSAFLRSYKKKKKNKFIRCNLKNLAPSFPPSTFLTEFKTFFNRSVTSVKTMLLYNILWLEVPLPPRQTQARNRGVQVYLGSRSRSYNLVGPDPFQGQAVTENKFSFYTTRPDIHGRVILVPCKNLCKCTLLYSSVHWTSLV